MKFKIPRILLLLSTGLISLTAVGGGLALLSGMEGDRFPLAWLNGTPFSDYTIPALLLIFAVGGSATIALIMNLVNLQRGISFSLTAGFILVGFITGEIILLKQEPPGPSVIELFYAGLGLLTIGLALFIWKLPGSGNP